MKKIKTFIFLAITLISGLAFAGPDSRCKQIFIGQTLVNCCCNAEGNVCQCF